MSERVIDRALKQAKSLGMNKSAFADKLGVRPQHITNWMKRGLPLAMHERVAKALHWTVAQLQGKTAPDEAPDKGFWPFSVPFADYLALNSAQKAELSEIVEDRIARFRAKGSGSKDRKSRSRKAA